MAENYTRMWDAFLGGEWEGGQEATESTDYMAQTQEFYKRIIGPAFGLPIDEEGVGFGSTVLEGQYAQFSNVDFETAEQTFRSEMGDPYGETYGDPFAWEKVSRYNTEAGGYGRIQDLLEDELYGQGKLLGGQTGADYGTATAKGLETYSSGLRGERESLTYEGLTGGAGLASGTGGSVLRSGESAGVAEDVLIEAYKKAKTLGSEYREGSEVIEQALSEDLDAALTTYLETIDEEKSRWFSSVMSNVETYRSISADPDDPLEEIYDKLIGNWNAAEAFGTGEYGTMTPEELKEHVGEQAYNDWSCGYGQYWDVTLDQCIDHTGGEDHKFRDDPACGIGQLWKENEDGSGGECVMMDVLQDQLELDDYGYLCDPNEIDECGECNGGNQSCNEGCGPNEGPPSYECQNGEIVCSDTDCSEVYDECGVLGGDGPQYLCSQGGLACGPAECEYETPSNCPPEDPTCDFAGDMECPDGWTWDETIADCVADELDCDFGFMWNPTSGTCVHEADYENQIECPDGTWAAENTTGGDEYANCMQPVEETPCDDGSLASENVYSGYSCPEDQPAYCNCAQIGVEVSTKTSNWGNLEPIYALVCDDPANPSHGAPCEGPEDPDPGTGVPTVGE